MSNINTILKEQLLKIKPSSNEVAEIDVKTKQLLIVLRNKLKKKKIKAEVFVGGSVAKNTLIKKKKYDIDIFVRFDSKYKDKEIGKLLKNILPNSAKVLHGSRDYFVLDGNGVEFEIIPTIKVNKPEDARNITDLSFFHVNYVESQINKKKGLEDEIRIAKGFAYYQDCYGAESYINGFSGYALELLIIHYKTFTNFIKSIAKQNPKQKIIIDMAKKYKNEKAIINELNEAKIHSPIILIDPTHKERNALAALSPKTFIKFQKSCIEFLKKPSSKFFELEDVAKKMENKYGSKLNKIILNTDRQPGDIAGTKLKKFHYYLEAEIVKFFDIKEHHFVYNEDKNQGIIYIVVNPKKEIFFNGPPISMKQPLAAFKKQHKKIIIKKGRAYARDKIISFNEFLKNFKVNKKKIIKEMSVRF